MIALRVVDADREISQIHGFLDGRTSLYSACILLKWLYTYETLVCFRQTQRINKCNDVTSTHVKIYYLLLN